MPARTGHAGTTGAKDVRSVQGARTDGPLANPDIDTVLAEFLEDQRARLSPKTFGRYRQVVHLLQQCLNGYGHQGLKEADRARFDRLYEAAGAEHREFCQIFGPEHIATNLGEFLDYFMIRKVMAGTDLMRAAGTVSQKLAAWLGERGYLSAEAAATGGERGARAARDLPRAERLARELHAFCADQPAGPFEDEEAGYFTITRVEGDRIWLESMAGEEYGPIKLPRGLGEQCRQDWELSGAVAQHRGRWFLADVWNVYP